MSKRPKSQSRRGLTPPTTLRHVSRIAAQTRVRSMTAPRKVPLDILLKYHERLARCASELPPSSALAWIQQRDEEERALWVERHRHTASPLGKIVKASLAICARANALFTSSVARRSCSTSAATCGKSQRRRVCVTRLSGCVRSRRPSSPGGTQQEARTTRLQRSSWRKL